MLQYVSFLCGRYQEMHLYIHLYTFTAIRPCTGQCKSKKMTVQMYILPNDG
jgi:hypothetical protein